MKQKKISLVVFFLFYFFSVSNAQTQNAEDFNHFSGLRFKPNDCKHLPGDFKVDFTVCNQYEVNFYNTSLLAPSVLWEFGDGIVIPGDDTVSHIFNSEGVYNVMLVTLNINGCFDTTYKKFLLNIDTGSLFQNKEIQNCKSSGIELTGDTNATKNCWTPPTYLNSPDIYNPISTPLSDISYQYNNIVLKGSAIINGTFSNGNKSFGTDYVFDTLINTNGYYFVGPLPKLWNKSYENCFMDIDTLFTGDTMMIVNGSVNKNDIVWKETVNVLPNTNYAFSFYARSLTISDSLQLEFSINSDKVVGNKYLAKAPCVRTRYSTSWYSDTDTTATIKIFDLKLDSADNNFAIDSISLRPIYLNHDSIKISLKPVSDFTIDPPLSTICPGDSVLLSASGGDEYQWSPASGVFLPNSGSSLFSPEVSTTYSVIIKENTCNKRDTLYSTVNVKSTPDLNLSKSNDLDCVNSQAFLKATGATQYHWSPEITLSNPNISNPIATPFQTTTYTVKGTGQNGCVSKDSLQIKVAGSNDKIKFLVPNAFTPNNDGINDCFGLKNRGNIGEMELFVFNRLGNLVFYSNEPSKCWDGKINGVLQESGTYVYYLKAQNLCGRIDEKGTICLIR